MILTVRHWVIRWRGGLYKKAEEVEQHEKRLKRDIDSRHYVYDVESMLFQQHSRMEQQSGAISPTLQVFKANSCKNKVTNYKK